MAVYRIFNQNDYYNVPYPNANNPSATIKSSGCGVCAMAMIMYNLGKIDITIRNLAKFSINAGARASSGTNMRVLANAVISKYPQLSYKVTNSETELRTHLLKGGMAIMNADGNDGVKGIFAAYGHYLTILEVRNNNPLVADPAYTINRYKSDYRKKYITELGDQLITCDWSTLDLDTKRRNPNYYLFSCVNLDKKNLLNEEEDELMYETIKDVPKAYRQAIQDLIDDGDLTGFGKNENDDLILNVTETFCRSAVVFGRKNPQYDTIDDVPLSYRPSVQKLIDKKILKGEKENPDGTLILNINEDFCRQVTINDRTGLYD